MKAAWVVLSSAYKILQNQMKEDGVVGDMVESLREMAGVASACQTLLKIGGTIDVIEEIGRCSLEAARIVHDYAAPSIRGKASIAARTAKHQLSDMPSRIAKCQKQCLELTEILHGRVQLDTNIRVQGLQDAQKGAFASAFSVIPH
ncbi:hypothetical protein FIBSPDRAFT_223665 [Athelia psychrophila]|uniref:Fungal N-terminal domain-containing protein n=1 Tax=Athelia psychrophila TaxID=1759441 RepID=A0A166S4U8_9AGAM|nr:hypothetical protein FIBSPDRAFT_223665 [Fibularhizoctonia sp. CBS 109695]